MWSGWADVADAVRGIGAAALAALLLLSLVNYALRLARWHRYLGPSAGSVPLFEHGLIYLAGFALTTTPGKAGETLRTAYLFRYGIGAARSVGAFVAERLSDVLLMLLLAAAGAWSWYGAFGQPVLVVLMLAALGSLILWFGRKSLMARLVRGVVARLPRTVRDGVQGALGVVREAFMGPGALASHILGGVAWAAEALALWLLLGWLGQDVSFVMCCSIYALSMLAGAVSMLPGGLGGADAAMVALLVLAGCDLPAAVAGTLVIRLATLWFAVLLGVLAIGMLNFGRRV